MCAVAPFIQPWPCLGFWRSMALLYVRQTILVGCQIWNLVDECLFTWNTIFLKLKIHPAAHSRRMLTVGMLAHKYFHQWAIFKYPKIVYSSQYQCQNWGSLLTISLIITMQCMLDSECLEQYPEDGPCIGSDADALVSVKTMEEIEGGWRLYIL